MGDWFQTIVDRNVSIEEAETLANEIRDWLVDRGIIQATMTDCILGGDGRGYPPGPNVEEVIGPGDHSLFLKLWTNGLGLVTGRTVFYSGQGETTVLCPKCRVSHGDHAQWGDVIGEWYAGKAALLRCPHCKTSTAITEWVFDPPWGFGNLGLVFWNWPPLKDDFISEIGDRLKHQIVVVKGKL
jgi:hypothetical protein